LVGGLGPAATMHYYLGLLAACEREAFTPRLIINQANLELVLAAAARGDREALTAHLSERMNELRRSGADLLAIAAVTPHMSIPELVQRVSLPIVDMVDVVNRELIRRGAKRVALMGTEATVASRLFGRLCPMVVDPSPGQIARTHDLYVSIVRWPGGRRHSGSASRTRYRIRRRPRRRHRHPRRNGARLGSCRNLERDRRHGLCGHPHRRDCRGLAEVGAEQPVVMPSGFVAAPS